MICWLQFDLYIKMLDTCSPKSLYRRHGVRDRRQIDFVHRSRTCSAMGGGGRPLNPRLKRK